jgi:hypothetical protein
MTTTDENIDPTLWVYTTDMSPQNCRIMNLLTPARQEQIYPAHVVGDAKIGLRGYLLRETGNGKYEETGEKAPLTPYLFEQMHAWWAPINSWMYDWPHWPFESQVTDEQLERLKVTLTDMMKPLPFDFKIVGLSPRMLRYFSDGDFKHQGRFLGLAVKPDKDPYARLSWDLLPRYQHAWGSLDRDNGVQMPVNLATGKRVEGSCLLHAGPAVAVRFLLDDQIAAFSGCRVYVKPSGEFIASDWCQRHDVTSYGNGINLQEGAYTFAGWVGGPCAIRAQENGTFKPKIKLSRDKIIDIIKREGPPVVIPTFEEAMTKVKTKALAERNKNVDSLTVRVSRAIEDKKPATAEELVTGIMDEMKTSFKEGLGAGLCGVRFTVPMTKVYLATSAMSEKFKISPTHLRLTAGFPPCGAEIQANKVCVKLSDGSHNHVPLQDLEIDWKLTQDDLEDRARELFLSTEPIPELTEITASAVKDAWALFNRASGIKLSPETDKLSQQTLERAAKMKVEVRPGEILPSVEPMGVEYSAPHWGYNVEIARVTPTLVGFQFTAEGDPEPYYVRGKLEGEEMVYGFIRNIASKKFMPVDMGSPLGEAVVFYFNDFLPRQLRAQKDAILSAKSFELDTGSFRGYPVIGGATILKVVDGAITESVTVRRKQNGHIYRVADDGSTEVMEPSDMKSAAGHYFNNYSVQEPTPVAQAAA